MTKHILFIACILWATIARSYACTSILVSKGASKDGSTMVTYAADAHVLYGELYHWPAKSHPAGSMLDIREWDTNKFLGKIKQVPYTYNVVGNMNEHQLIITESTFGGRPELQDTTGIMDYGSLIYVTLQRAKTAQEAIKVMTDLVEEYGYYSSGESFSIADPNEVWVMEMIGKGNGKKGAIWVARRIPDGYLSAHANQARITTFPLKDKNTIYAKDVISFAREKGYFSGKDEEFDFSAAYAPLDFGAARFSDARVWSVFRRVNPDMEQYVQYAQGDISQNRMPLWVKPASKLSVQDVMSLMRDHYEGTSLDMTQDVGAGPHALPYRWRPLTWKSEGQTYANERAISTQQTGFSLVGQARGWLPNEIGGILWFGVDDTYSTCYTPIYSSSTRVPATFAVGNGDMLTYAPEAAFWVFNRVTNFAYMRYDLIIKDIQHIQASIEGKHVAYVPAIDQAASLLHKQDPELAVAFLTDYSVQTADAMVKQWSDFADYLLVKYIDGNVKKEENGRFLRTRDGYPASPNFPGYTDSWRKRIADDTKDRLRIKEEMPH